ncbi:MAG: hypothetical protein K9N55_07375 [Phycisphaerae bacterium]|nr:hypothetical protein [Phycisphaerae bacterium]
MRRKNRTHEQAQIYWQGVIGQWKDSGLTAAQFIKQNRLHDSLFYVWRKRLLGAQDSDKTPAQKSHTAQPFIQVKMPPANTSGLELVLVSGNRLKISTGMNQETLAQTVSVLQEAGLC